MTGKRMTPDQAIEAGRVAERFKAVHEKIRRVVDMPDDADLGIDITFDHCESGNEVIGDVIVLGKEGVLDVLQIMENLLALQLRALEVEP